MQVSILIKTSALDEIPEDTFFNATDLIEKLIAENKKVIRFPLNGTWIDISKRRGLFPYVIHDSEV